MAYQSEIEKLEARFREKPEQWFAALADQYRRAGDVDMALELLNAWIDKRPNYTSGYIVLGRCLLDRERLGDAAHAFENVLRLDMENVIALKSLSEIAEQRGDLDGARTWLKRLLDADPMNEEAREALDSVGRPQTGEVAAVEATETPEPGLVADAVEAAEPTEAAEPQRAEAFDAPLDIERVSEPEGFVLPEPSVAGAAEAAESATLGGQEEPAGPEAVEPMADLEPTGLEGLSDIESAAVDGLEPAGYGAPADEPLVEEDEAGPTGPEEPVEPPAERPFAGAEPTEAEPPQPEAGLTVAGVEPTTPEEESSLVGVPELEEYRDATSDEAAESRVVAEPAEPGPAEAFEEDLPLPAQPTEPAPEPEVTVEAAAGSPAGGDRDDVQFIEPPPDAEGEAEAEEAAEVEAVAEEEQEEVRSELPIILPEEVAPELDEPGVREPEPVVTETMAELYVSQGLYAEARDIYGKLLEHNPGSDRIRTRLAEVVEQAAGAKADVAPTHHDRFAASATGGLSVADLMRQLSGAPRGAGKAPDEASGSGFSFDEYFGARDASEGLETPKSSTPESAQAEPAEGTEDEDFRDWLKGLKT